jgi:hypothetical protein
MKIIMSEKEAEVIQALLINIADQPLTETPGILTIKHKKLVVGENVEVQTVIDINEKYVTTLYGEVNKWLPGIVSTIKGVVVLIKSFMNAISETENSLLKKLKPEKASDKE